MGHNEPAMISAMTHDHSEDSDSVTNLTGMLNGIRQIIRVFV